MKAIVTDKYIMKVANFQSCVDMICPDDCYAAKDGLPNKCAFTQVRNAVNNNKLHVAITKLVIKNISSEPLSIKGHRFDVVDSFGFIYQTFEFCRTLHKDSRAMTHSYELPPNTQIYFNLYTVAFEEGTQLSKVCYTDMNNKVYTIKMSEFDDEFISTEEKLKIENYKLSDEFKKLQEEEKTYEEKMNAFRERMSNANRDKEPISYYRTEEDDEYLYIISEEKEKHLTFSRRFDRNKSNYNWVNIGEPLIYLYLDEDNSGLGYSTCEIDSPATGIFEFDKKRFIAYNEVICRIRKYSIEEKAEVFRELEKEAIKETLLRREQKKKLEREALDELIAEGLIFNTYIDKMGNRNKIPNELANAVWNRDGGRCCFCNSNENLEFDHIIPVSKGGATTFQNLQLLCKPCNIRKTNKIG